MINLDDYPIQEKFWAKVDKISNIDGCWIWLGAVGSTGYGNVGVNRKHIKKTYQAHLVSLLFSGINIPEGMLACHICDNRLCVNPEHIFFGTHQDNSDDKVSKLRHRFGENHPSSKLSDKQIFKIRELYNSGKYTQQEIANMYSVSRGHISDIVLLRRRVTIR